MRIEQTLHGYLDGHRLLSATVELPRTSKYAMLALSDMSGRSMVGGFEEYLTGYPVPDTTLYAFAKTWYAPEIERPGCVWTHTLLLAEQDLAAIPDLGVLRRLFRCPSGKTARTSWDDYRTSIEYPSRAVEGTAMPLELADPSRLVLWAVYGIPDAPVFQPAEDTRRFEDLVLALWSQQWARLRFDFRFCTGAIANRSNDVQLFDLQVIPVTSVREVRREVPGATIIASGGWPVPPEDPEWVGTATRDLLEPSKEGFRSFLSVHTHPGFEGRRAFAPLAELFPIRGWDRERGTLASLLDKIGSYYPGPTAGKALKPAVAGRDGPLGTILFSGTSEADILRALATTRRDESFDPAGLDVEGRARILWAQDQVSTSSLVSFLIGNDHNAIGERILLSLIQGMSIDDAAQFSASIPGLVSTLVRLNPSVAVADGLWRGSSDHQRELFDAATGGRVTPDDLQRAIMLAMLRAGSDSVAERAVRRFGPGAVSVVMTWFNESMLGSPSALPDGWRRAIASQPAALLDWLASTPAARETSAALVADLLNPHSAEVQRRGADLWLKPIRDSAEDRAGSTRIRLQAFLLALGFGNPPGRADELVVRSFGTVHQAIADSRLDYDSWSWLEDQLPTLSWTRNWDKCERLRRGLIDSFVRFDWPVAQFLRCPPDDIVLRSLLKSCTKTDAGETLLKKIKRALRDDGLQMGRKQRELVEGYV